MKKTLSLIKVSLGQDMNIFKINTKKQTKIGKIVPVLLALYLMGLFGMYTVFLMDTLEPIHSEYIAITLFALGVSIVTLMEGIYKSGSLLFNCKDDNLLLSLPIEKSTVMYVRILKFYLFELVFNSIFFVPTLVAYAIRMNPGFTYYIASIFGVILLPVIPVILSCIIGFFITSIASNFKGKNIIQTILTTLLILVCIYFSYNSEGLINSLAAKANSINDLITKLYYPVGALVTMATDFKILDLIKYIVIHIVAIFISLILLSKVYYQINTKSMKVLSKSKNTNYKIKTNTKRKAFIKKELNKFFQTPVYITNTGFGLVMFIAACFVFSVNFDAIAATITSGEASMSLDEFKSVLPIIMFCLIAFGTLMTSITSSMISLEGKSFNILKSLPLKPIEIVMYKVMTSMIITVPCILVGDFIVLIILKFNIISMIILIIASFILPLLTAIIGILANLKFPKLDATNDTEVVKQSMSSLISVVIGLIMMAMTFVLIFLLFDTGLNANLVIGIFTLVYGLITFIFWTILNKTCVKSFENIVC